MSQTIILQNKELHKWLNFEWQTGKLIIKWYPRDGVFKLWMLPFKSKEPLFRLFRNHNSCIHVNPWSSGRLPEMSPKISFKTYHFLPKFGNLPDLNKEFSYIFYIFLINLPEMRKENLPDALLKLITYAAVVVTLTNLPVHWYSVNIFYNFGPLGLLVRV